MKTDSTHDDLLLVSFLQVSKSFCSGVYCISHEGKLYRPGENMPCDVCGNNGFYGGNGEPDECTKMGCEIMYETEV